MSKSSRHIRVRSGQFEFVKLNAKELDWRDTYYLILTLSWPGFAGLVFGIYVLINLGFAGLYILDPRGVAEHRDCCSDPKPHGLLLRLDQVESAFRRDL
jgi:hypothetical protein